MSDRKLTEDHLRLKLVRDAKALIADPEHWAKGKYAARADGTACTVDSPEAVKFCAVGALTRTSRNMGMQLHAELFRSIFPWSIDLVGTNDSGGGHTAIMEIFTEAEQRLEREVLHPHFTATPTENNTNG